MTFDNVLYGEFNTMYKVRGCLHPTPPFQNISITSQTYIAYMSGTPLSLSGHISCSILIDELSQKRLLQNQLGNLQVLILILMKQQRKFSKFYLSKDFQIEELGYGCRHWDQFVQRILLKVTQTILAKLIYR